MKGSGVILFVLVALWALALVPAMLRRHDSATESRSVDRFSHAMRILSRRTPQAAGHHYVVMPARPPSAVEPEITTKHDPVPARWRVTQVSASTGRPAEPAAPTTPTARAGSAAPRRSRPSLAVRRRRLLLALVTATLLLTLVALAAGGLWWGAATCSGVLVVAYLGHLRSEARRASELARRRRSMSQRPVAHRDAARSEPVQAPGDVAGVSAAAPGVPAEVPIEDDGEHWDPVDVPLPTYVTKPAAPRRTVDLTRPGVWSDTLFDAEDAVDPAQEAEAEADELEEIIARRRAVGD